MTSALVFRFMQIFCAASMFEVQCNQFGAANSSHWLEELQDTGCAAACQHSHPNINLEECFTQCTDLRKRQLNATTTTWLDHLDRRAPHQKTPERLPLDMTLRLVCRDDISMQLQLHIPDEAERKLFGGATATTSTATPKPLIIYRLQETDNLLGRNIVNITDSPTVQITQLQPNTTYNVSATLVNADLTYADASNNYVLLQTLSAGRVPDQVHGITFGPYEVNADGETLGVTMFWEPGPDRGCFYDVVKAPDNEGGGLDAVTVHIRSRPPLFRYRFTDLLFDNCYNMGVQSIHRNPYLLQSELKWTRLVTPTCLEMHAGNMSICDPYEPTALNYTATLQPDAEHILVHATWQMPAAVQPDHYVVRIADDQNHTYVVRVPGDALATDFGGAALQLHGEIVLIVYAYNADASRRSAAALEIDLAPVYRRAVVEKRVQQVRMHDGSTDGTVIAVVAVLTVALALAAVALLMAGFLWQQRSRRGKFSAGIAAGNTTAVPAADAHPHPSPHSILVEAEPHLLHEDSLLLQQIHELQSHVDAATDSNESLAVEPLSPGGASHNTTTTTTLGNNATTGVRRGARHLEIDRDCVRFVSVIGKGAFGLVHRAVWLPDGRTVAVKTLRSTLAVEDMRDFYHEMEVMKSVASHPHILGIVGHYTRNVRAMMLLTEFCDEGNLQSFLHRIDDRLRQMEAEAVAVAAGRRREEEVESVVGASVANRTYDWDLQEAAAAQQRAVDVMGGVCDAACKCPVEIVVAADDSGVDSDESAPPSAGAVSIRVHDCDCGSHHRHKTAASSSRLQPQQQQQVFDNPSYMQQLAASTSAATWTLNGKPAPAARGKPAAERPPAPDESASSVGQRIITITSRDLLAFAEQIADGMRFLAAQKIVHRDLAARNVLVCSDKQVKVSDFGLSRDVYEDNVYKKTSDGKVPIKWMAIESLLRLTYTTQSDVWSFGVLLYELVTLGGTPYPDVQGKVELLHYLEDGRRMARPAACGEELYALMADSWTEMAVERPTFAQVQERLLAMLEEADNGGVEQVLLRRVMRPAEDAVEDEEKKSPTIVVLRASEAEAKSDGYLTPQSARNFF